jgi:hypothetical protein
MGGGAAASGNGQQGQDPKQAIQEFTQLAQQIQQMAQKYPEFVESATQILPLIQKGMVRVSGNPDRVPEKQAPPGG